MYKGCKISHGIWSKTSDHKNLYTQSANLLCPEAMQLYILMLCCVTFNCAISCIKRKGESSRIHEVGTVVELFFEKIRGDCVLPYFDSSHCMCVYDVRYHLQASTSFYHLQPLDFRVSRSWTHHGLLISRPKLRRSPLTKRNRYVLLFCRRLAQLRCPAV